MTTIILKFLVVWSAMGAITVLRWLGEPATFAFVGYWRATKEKMPRLQLLKLTFFLFSCGPMVWITLGLWGFCIHLSKRK